MTITRNAIKRQFTRGEAPVLPSDLPQEGTQRLTRLNRLRHNLVIPWKLIEHQVDILPVEDDNDVAMNVRAVIPLYGNDIREQHVVVNSEILN
ncbi:TPA: hypothetical protein MH565_27940 [Klebsiella pneumoniae]|uniref:Uncharacterized protein n=8 Tax=Klebsiella pneumoniae complex TaxID=3390273 RepID=A0AB73WBP0_KLEPN|nr:hypothetical protein RJF2_26290 [Klebsiella pneumoniae subsp. pneumoniae]APM46570.1 hypothetical protein BB788_27210 [Klebsiella pneumoniae]KPO03048.1 hypothetical protein AO842_23015 [Klebsiella sp. AA405]OED24644.1 hypothetical protein BCY82_24610 [Klebsiella quasipneumoniae]AMA33326.1 hypothetical protein RJF9_27695 [Klebsiella pneumoniae subsp. pneumoniae]